MKKIFTLFLLSITSLVFASSADSRMAAPIQQLVSQYDSANEACRGGPGDNLATQKACQRREGLYSQIKNAGWCWGPTDALEYQKQWVVCKGRMPQQMRTADQASTEKTKWLPLSSSMFVLSSEHNKKVMMSAGIDTRNNQVGFRIFDLSGVMCKPNIYSPPEGYPSVKINGKYVQMESICINGSQLISPKTEIGRRYLKEQVESGHLTIDTSMGPILEFKGTPPVDLQEKLQASQSAM
jgi:hypothetical protein